MSGDVDGLPELPALDVGPDPDAGERELPRLLLGDVRGDLYAVPELPVDLDEERDRLGADTCDATEVPPEHVMDPRGVARPGRAATL